MTAEEAVIALASAAAVGFMVLAAWLLGFRTSVVLDEALARTLIAEHEPAAEIVEIAIDARGRAGLARLANGSWAAIASMGDRFAVRIFARIRLTARAGLLKARFEDAGFPALDLAVDAQTGARLAGRV